MMAMDARLVRNPDVLQASLGESEIALLSAKASIYFGLEGSASAIWNLLEKEQTLQGLCEVLIDSYDVPPDVCARDAAAFVAELIEHDLVRIINAET